MADLAAGESYGPLHLAVQPGGVCRVCGDPWPCAVERAALVQEYRDARSSLLIYLCLQLIDALERSPVSVAGELCVRYLGWVPSWVGGGDSYPSDAMELAQDRHDARHDVRAV